MLFYQYNQLMEWVITFSLKWVIKFSLKWVIKFSLKWVTKFSLKWVIKFSLKWVIKLSLKWVITFCSDGLHVVALISVIVRSFVLSIRSNVFRRYQPSSVKQHNAFLHWLAF